MVSERRTIAQHAGTVFVGQLAVMGFSITDAVVSGRYDERALAALSVSSAIFVSVYISLMGILQALLPVWAESHGAGRKAEVGASLRQALYLCGMTIALGMAVLWAPGPLLRWTDVPPDMRGDVERYLGVLAFALAPALLFRLFSTLNQSIGQPQFVTWLQLGSLLLKLPLSVWFTFGGAGVPAMGLVGCGWATFAVNWTMLAAAIWLLRTRPIYAEYRLWRRIEAPDWRQIARFARLGLPGGMSILVEVTSFTLMALFIARLGTTATAAHQIAANLTAVGYMLPLSLSIATSARVSFWLGATDPAKARHAFRCGFELVATCALLYAAGLAALRGPLAGMYSDNPAVISSAVGLLLVAALYHLADAIQVLCVFVLRCYRVTVLPLVLYSTMLWGVGLGGSYLLAYRGLGPWQAMRSPMAFWVMSGVALAMTALLILALAHRTVRRAR